MDEELEETQEEEETQEDEETKTTDDLYEILSEIKSLLVTRL